MLQFCLNYPFLPGGSPDLRHRPEYNTMCYPFNFEPGRTTYLDTPVLRQAAFVGPLQQTLDCEFETGIPGIKQVTTDAVQGPWIPSTGGTITIMSRGLVMVPNPAYPGTGPDGFPADPPIITDEKIERDYGFGGSGTVLVNNLPIPGSVVWGNDQITVTLAAGDLADGTYQLMVIKADGSPTGSTTEVGITLHVGGPIPTPVTPGPGAIQAAIDAASDGDLILVTPGIYYELPILYKRVALQGAGAGSTTIFASHFSSGPALENPLVEWNDKIALLTDGNLGNGEIGLLPEQQTVLANTPEFFLKDGEGPGIFVSPLESLNFNGARIDGFNITNAGIGGAIYVNAYAERLQISNNKMSANAGRLGGAIRIGNPTEVVFALGGTAVETSPNERIDIQHNQINQNGSLTAGGGIAIFKGADRYGIADNFICGNLARSGGGGIAHHGLSDLGTIVDNTIAFNEVFQGGQPGPGLGATGGGGGGIEIAGDPDAAGGLTEGAGDVTIDRNLIQGNLGGAADGGGIALRNVNGQDVEASNNSNNWYKVEVNRNVIVNNVSGSGGAGIALQDAANVDIERNTIANNDSTATSIFAGIGTPPTEPQAAGIVSRPHSTALATASEQIFSNPDAFTRNIFYQNRSFYWDAAAVENAQGGLLPLAAAPVYWDLGVMGAGTACLQPIRTRLTALNYGLIDPSDCNYPGGPGGNANTVGDPGFPGEYFNDLLAAAAADEGGNFVQVYYTPLGVQGDYTDTVGGGIGPTPTGP
jgi:hypothetical protein